MATTDPHDLSNSAENINDDVSTSKSANDFSGINFHNSSIKAVMSSELQASTSKQMSNEEKLALSHMNPQQNFIPSDMISVSSHSENRNNLVQFSSVQDDYGAQSFNESLHSIRLSQFNDSSSHSGGLVHYSDGRDGVTLTTLPLISENGLVNLVELEDGLTVDTSLETSQLDNGVIYGNSSQNMPVVSEDNGERRQMDGNFTYLATTEDDVINVDNPITITGVTDTQGNPITVPLSFLNTPNGQALLQQLGIGQADSDQTSIFLTQLPSDEPMSITSEITQSENENNFLQEALVLKSHQKEITHITNNKLKSKTPIRHGSVASGLNNRVTGKNGPRVLGSGPLAISAHGILEQVNGRTVTVLPRPEDLQRLMDHKALVVDIPDDKNMWSPKKRGPVPIIPHQRYKRGRGKRGRPRTIPRNDDGEGGYTVPKVSKRGRRGRRGKRGRGAGSIMVVNSSGRRPGRPRKATTLIEGPNGARMIHTGLPEPQEDDPPIVDFEDPVAINNDCLKDLHLPKESVDPVSECFSPKSSKRKLPPRTRGTKYSKMIEALMRPDDEMPSDSSEEEYYDNGDKLSAVYRTGKRGRPRKHPLNAPKVVKLIVRTPLTRVSSFTRYFPPHFQRISIVTGIPKRPHQRLKENYVFSGENSLRLYLSPDNQDGVRAILDSNTPLYPIETEEEPNNVTISSYESSITQNTTASKSSDSYSVSYSSSHNGGFIISADGEISFPEHLGMNEMSDSENNMNMENISLSEVRERVDNIDEMEKERITLVAGNDDGKNTFDLDDTDSKMNILNMTMEERRTTSSIYIASSDANITGQIMQESSVIEIKEEAVENKGHECEYCGEIMLYKRDFIRHLRNKHNMRPFECSHCSKTYTSMIALQEHEAMHSLETPFKCTICAESFDRYSSLRNHLKNFHSSDSEYNCDKCGDQLPSASQMKKHMLMHESGVAFGCEVCGKLCVSEEQLEEHLKSHSKDRPIVCDICNIGFYTAGGLNKHRKMHKREEIMEDGSSSSDFVCKFCYAQFTYEESLQKHMVMLHTLGTVKVEKKPVSFPLTEEKVVEKLKEQLNIGYAPKNSELYDLPGVSETLESKSLVDPFRCGICEESFTDVDILCDHFGNNHTGEQKFYCDYCVVGCADEIQLARHLQVHENEEKMSHVVRRPDDLAHLCLICGKSYETAKELTKHNRVHNIDKPYKCTICNAVFPLKSALSKHILVHTGERPFKCDICLKSFRQSAALVRHKLWTHKLKNQNKCEICGKTFFTSALLLYHLDVHGEAGLKMKLKLKDVTSEIDNEDVEDKPEMEDPENNPNNECEYCSKRFPSYVALLTHKLSHKLSASYKCEFCHRTFREKRYLKKHKLTHKGIRSWKCEICNKGFAAKLTLIRHSQVHLREALRPMPNPIIKSEDGSNVCTLPSVLRCEECNVVFQQKIHYVRHKLLHSGTPLLKCGLCDKMFVHKSDIIRHKVMHSFLFSCDVCGRNFHKRSLYLIHKKKHNDNKPFKCKQCGKSFTCSSNYTSHMRIHSGDKPYRCDRCPYRCSQSGRLTKHKRMHVGIKPFRCGTCGKFFANAESIRIHQRIHTGERPFKCTVCSKSFINSGSLNQHMKDHAKEELYKCHLCPHKFRRETHLAKHNVYHQQHLNGKTPTLFMCEICGRVFEKKKYLYTHNNVHNRLRTFHCRVCDKQLASRLALRNHEHIHTGEMPYKCIHCFKEFRSNSNLKRHMRVHQGPIQCIECSETFYSEEDLEEHHQRMHVMMVNSTGDQSIAGANHTTTQLYVFESMADEMDSNTQQSLFVEAPQPLLVFNENSESQFEDLHQSSATHHEQFESAGQHHQVMLDEDNNQHSYEPDTVEAINGNRQVHIFKASDLEMVLPSNHHEQMLQQNGNDQQIEYILPSRQQQAANTMHISEIKQQQQQQPVADNDQLAPTPSKGSSDSKTHQCTICLKYFAKKQYLTKHMYRHRAVKPHTCDICGKGFAQKFEVVVHKIKHTGEKPYTCDICQKQFRSKVNLSNHKMRHNGEFPFLCSVCRKGFSTQLQLQRHVTLHAGGMLPFTCEICQKGYSIRLNLVKHLAKAHNIVEDRNLDSNDEQDNDTFEEAVAESGDPDSNLKTLEYVKLENDNEESNYSPLGHIAIRNRDELMESESETGLIPKHSSSNQTLSHSIGLSIHQTIATKDINHDQLLGHLDYSQQSEISESGVYEIQSHSGNDKVLGEESIKIENVTSYQHYQEEDDGAIASTSMDRFKPQMKSDNTNKMPQFLSDNQQTLRNMLQNNEFTDSKSDSSQINNVSVIGVPQSILKDYYIQPNDMLSSDMHNEELSFLPQSSSKQIQNSHEIDFVDDGSSSTRVINLNDEHLDMLTSENMDGHRKISMEDDVSQNLVSVVVVSEGDNIDVDHLN